MKTIMILIFLIIGISLNAQRVIHSDVLKCYIDLGKIVEISDLDRYHDLYGVTGISYPIGKAPDWVKYRGQWYFTIIYQYRDDRTHYFRADTVDALQTYNQIVNQWKEYNSPTIRNKIFPEEELYIFDTLFFDGDTIILRKPKPEYVN